MPRERHTTSDRLLTCREAGWTRVWCFGISDPVLSGKAEAQCNRVMGLLLLYIGLCAGWMVFGSRLSADDYSLEVWQLEHGLPSESIVSIAQTSDGFLWVGTTRGLVRFDGVRFRKPNGPSSLSSERVSCLFLDSTGALWVSMYSGELFRRDDGVFVSVPTDLGRPLAPVRSVALDRKDGLVLTTTAGGLFRYRDGRFIPIWEDSVELSVEVEAIADAFGDGTVWVRRGATLGVLKGLEWVEVPCSRGPSERLGPFAARRNGGVWLFASERNLDCLQHGRWPMSTRRYPAFMDPSRLLEDSRGNLWIGTLRQGLVRFAERAAPERFFTGTGFMTDGVTALFEDRNGAIWVGGSNGGLARLARRTFSSVRGPDAAQSAPLCLSPDASGSVWVGFGESGLYRVQDGVAVGPVTLGGRKVIRTGWAVLAGGDGLIGYSEYGLGLNTRDAGGFRLWTAADGLPTNDIETLREDGSGGLWIGCQRGLVHWTGGQFIDVTSRDGLPKRPVHAIEIDSEGTVWAGLSGMGLVKWNSGGMEVFRESHGLVSDRVRALLWDDDGILWVGGSTGFGSRRDGKFFVFGERTGIPRLEVGGIVNDQMGRLWLATNRGVLCVAKADLMAVMDGLRESIGVRRFGVTDGLPSIWASRGQPCAARAVDGRIWFATLKGLAVVNPAELPTNAIPPAVVIDEIVLDGRSQVLSGADRTVLVPAGTKRIEFKYSAPQFTGPEGGLFKRRVDGLDDDWQEPSTEREISFYSLRPGAYRLRVLAASTDGVWNETDTSLEFSVEPWFWETLWFRTSAGLLAVFLVGIAFWAKTRVLEKRRAAQERFSRLLIEQQELERKRIAAELHDGLGQTLSIIRNRAVLVSAEGDVGPKIATHVAGISDAAVEALSSVREICQGLRPAELDRLGLCATLTAMADRLAAGSTMRVLIQIDPVDELISNDLWIHVMRLVQESLNNVVKHSKATEVRVSLQERERFLDLEISDNGVGFDCDGASKHRSGLGFSTLVERAGILGATFSILASPGQGTTIRLEIPKLQLRTVLETQRPDQ